MQTILKGLRDLDGVNGTFLSDISGQVLAFNAESIYDASLLTQVSRAIANAIDSVRLIQEDWETITTQFSEGRLLIRNIAPNAKKGGAPLTLTLIADSRLNPSFATVAVRVAIGKIKTILDANGGTLPATVSVAEVASPAPAPPLAASAAALPHNLNASFAGAPAVTHSTVAAPDVAGSGLNWSGLGGSSAMSASGVSVADAASSAVLTACTKALARAVGPMAKVFVKEGVRRITAGQPFSKTMLAALITELEKEIEDSADRAEFRKVTAKLS
jgi:hypothetical protein